MKTMRGYLIALGLLFTLSAHAETHIQAMCNVTMLGSQCTFSNTGADAGSGCATVVLTNRSTRQQIRSGVVCSGDMQSNTTGTAMPIQFIGNVFQHCGGPNPGGIQANCEMQVEMSNVQVKGGAGAAAAGTACGGLMWLLVLLASIYVYSDAKKRNNPNAVGWAVGTFFLFIIVFPWYMLTRDKQPPGGGGFPPGGGYGPPGGGFPPQGGGFPPPGGGYGPQGGGFPPPGGGFAPPGGGFPPQGGGYGPQGGGFPPQGGGGYGPPGGFPPPGGGYPPA